MRVAAAAPADVADWLGLRTALWPDMATQDHRREAEALLAKPDGIALLAWNDAARAVGLAEATLRRDHVNGCETSPVAFLEGLYVDPAARRAGVARKLLAHVEAWARATGVVELASDAEQDNAAGLAMHSALGFAETERVVFFRKLVAAGPDGSRDG